MFVNENMLMKERGLIAPQVAIKLVTLLFYTWEVRGSNIWWFSSIYSGKFGGMSKTVSTPLLSTFFIIH
jgi:hypothetical protein